MAYIENPIQEGMDFKTISKNVGENDKSNSDSIKSLITANTYTGTGTYGVNNPTVIAIKPTTQIVIIGDVSGLNGTGCLVLVRSQKTASVFGGTSHGIKVSWSDTEVSFYHTSNANYQANTLDRIYPYVLVG